MHINVTLANQYGREVIRPACPIADKFCQLLDQKTLTPSNVSLIKAMGYEIRVTTTQPECL